MSATSKFPLAGQVAIVTGGSRGLGRATATAFAAAGAKLVITGRTADVGERVAGELAELSPGATFVACDMTSEPQVEALVSRTVEIHGPPTVLINNAAPTRLLVGPERIEASVTELGLEAWNEMLKQFITGPFLAIKHVMPKMVEAGGGSIVNLGSTVSRMPIPGGCGYTTGKAAIDGLTRSVATDGGPHGVRCNCIMVGSVPAVDPDLDDLPQAAYMNEVHRTFSDPDSPLAEAGPKMQLLGRYGAPADVAGLATFLASPASAFLTAAIIPCDGGATARWPVSLEGLN
jgi:NAD(P)-dependent dehydrogenase (short-subunit alcohol dehydrogenase family)